MYVYVFIYKLHVRTTAVLVFFAHPHELSCGPPGVPAPHSGDHGPGGRVPGATDGADGAGGPRESEVTISAVSLCGEINEVQNY